MMSDHYILAANLRLMADEVVYLSERLERLDGSSRPLRIARARARKQIDALLMSLRALQVEMAHLARREGYAQPEAYLSQGPMPSLAQGVGLLRIIDPTPEEMRAACIIEDD